MKNDLTTDINYLLVKRGLYYKPNNQGYTGIKEYAGRYIKSEERLEINVIAIHEDEAPEFSKSCWPECKIEYYKNKIEDIKSRLSGIISTVKMAEDNCHVNQGKVAFKQICDKCGALSNETCYYIAGVNDQAIKDIKNYIEAI